MDDESNKFIIFDWKHFEINFFIGNPKKKHLWYVAVNGIQTINFININLYRQQIKNIFLMAIKGVINSDYKRSMLEYVYITTDDLTTYPPSQIQFLNKTLFTVNKELNRDKLTKFGLTIKNDKFQ
jgi:hypothetical protein